MTEKAILQVLDLIMNEADQSDLKVLEEALKRRRKDLSRVGMGKMNPQQLARETARQVRQQMDISMPDIHGIVRNMVADMIRQKAPEIGEEDLAQLLDHWVPDEEEQKKRQAAQTSKIPADALLTMIKQFVAHKSGGMSRLEEMKLREEIPEWPDKYWSCFPVHIQKLIVLFLENQLDSASFWQEIQKCLQNPG